MKRIIAIALAMFLVISLASCKDSPSNKITKKAGKGVSAARYVEPSAPSEPFDEKSVTEQIEVEEKNIIDNTKIGGKGSTAVAKVKNNSDYVVTITPSFKDDNGKAIDTSNAINKIIYAVSPEDEIIISAESENKLEDFSVSFKVEENKDCVDVKKHIETKVLNADTAAKDYMVKIQLHNTVDRNVDRLLTGYVLYKDSVPVYINNGTFNVISIGQTMEVNVALTQKVAESVKFDKIEPMILFATSKK